MGSGGGAIPRRRPLSLETNNMTRSSSAAAGGGTINNDLPEAAPVAFEEPLSPAARMFHQPSFNCYIIAVMGFGRKLDVNIIRAGLEATLVHHPRFSSILVLVGREGKKQSWVRTKVVVENHVVVPDMDPEATSKTPDQQLEDYLSSLSTTPMDLSRPLWDLHILNIRTSDAEAVGVLRIHHSLGDGVSLMSLLLACTRKTSDPDSLPTIPEARQPDHVKRSLWVFLLQLWAVLVLLWHTLVDLLLFVTTAIFLQDTKTPLLGAEGVEFRRKRFVHRTASLDDVKTIKKKMGCTVNDVLVGVTSAGLSRYLSRSFNNEGNGGEKKSDLPPNIRIRTTLLVNIRKAPGIHNLAEMMKGKGSGARWGNCLGYVVMPFPILKCKDPLEYIRKGKAIAERKKKSLEAFLTNKAAFWVVKLFGIKAAVTVCHRVLSHTTLSFSNLFGPVEEVGFYGHPMVYIAPSVYGHPQALTLHFQSYMNKLTIVAAVDELSIPDPHQLLDDLIESLKLIKEAAEE